MHKAVAHHLPTDGLTVPEQQPPDSFSPVYVLSMTPYGPEYLFGQAGSAVPAVSHASILCLPASSLWVG